LSAVSAPYTLKEKSDMRDRKPQHSKAGRNKRTGQQSECAKVRDDVPCWQQDKQTGGRGPNGVQSQPRSVGKRYWRM
jgi:hypothetical protein